MRLLVWRAAAVAGAVACAARQPGSPSTQSPAPADAGASTPDAADAGASTPAAVSPGTCLVVFDYGRVAHPCESLEEEWGPEGRHVHLTFRRPRLDVNADVYIDRTPEVGQVDLASARTFVSLKRGDGHEWYQMWWPIGGPPPAVRGTIDVEITEARPLHGSLIVLLVPKDVGERRGEDEPIRLVASF